MLVCCDFVVSCAFGGRIVLVSWCYVAGGFVGYSRVWVWLWVECLLLCLVASCSLVGLVDLGCILLGGGLRCLVVDFVLVRSLCC